MNCIDYVFYNIECRQVLQCLAQVESVSSFQDFVATFSQFGKHMVELAHLTGDRQNVSSVAFSSLSYLWLHMFLPINTLNILHHSILIRF